jgi:solute carrier family 25 protein 14/30
MSGQISTTLPLQPQLQQQRQLTFFSGALVGGLSSCIAEACTYPFDFAKTRLQIQAIPSMNLRLPSMFGQSIATNFTGMFDILTRMPRQDSRGFRVLYDGLRPALLRQASYGTLKVVSYERVKYMLDDWFQLGSVTRSLLAGVAAGAISSAICTPTDLVKVRMAGGDRSRHYTSFWKSIGYITRTEGFLALYKGISPTTFRAVFVTLLNLPAYDLSKEYLVDHPQVVFLNHKWRDDIYTHVTASVMSGVVSTYGSNPIDTVKSRIMNQPVDPTTNKGLLYRNSWHCLLLTCRQEGVSALWKGSVPNFCRTVLWLIIFFCTYEPMKRLATSV